MSGYGRGMRSVLALVASLALLAGCGDDGGASGEQGEPAASSSPTETKLVNTCPEVESAIRRNEDADGYSELKSDLDALAESGDTETKNALVGLIEATAQLIEHERKSDAGELSPEDAMTELLDAQDAFDGAVGTLADRCEAVGSSALQ